MTTRIWICLGLGLTPLLAHCTEIRDRDLMEELGGSTGASSNGGGMAGSSGSSGNSGTGEPTGGAGSAPGAGQGGTAGTTNAGGGGDDNSGMGGHNTGGSDAGPNDGVLGHPDPLFPYPTYPGFTLYMAEEFNEPFDLATDPIWTYSDGGLDEAQTRYVKSALTFAQGRLRIRAEVGEVAGSASYSQGKSIGDRPLSSGELRTKYNNFRYGRYEAAIKAPLPDSINPNTNGNFISGLSILRQPNHQDWREIAMQLTGDNPVSLTTLVRYANNTTSWMSTIQHVQTVSLGAGFTSRTATHVYAFEWTPDQIVWFVDGQKVFEGTNGGPNDLSVDVPEKSAKILLNLWIFNGTGFGGDPANNVYPLDTEIDWFRFYRWDQDLSYPCTPAPACLSVADKDQAKNNAEDGVADL